MAAKAGIKASRLFHQKLLKSIIRASFINFHQCQVRPYYYMVSLCYVNARVDLDTD